MGRFRSPVAGNRFQLEVDDVEALVTRLREHGARFRDDVVIIGVGGKEILLEDPAGNPIELFQPTIAEAKLASYGLARERSRPCPWAQDVLLLATMLSSGDGASASSR